MDDEHDVDDTDGQFSVLLEEVRSYCAITKAFPENGCACGTC